MDANEPFTVLVPVDGSEPSFRALTLAVELVRARRATGVANRLRIVSVVDVSRVDVYDGFYLSNEQIEHLKDTTQRDILDEAKRRALSLAPNVDVETVLVVGRAAKEILDEAKSVHHVVAGRTGRTAFTQLLQGSVCRSLVDLAPCIVSIVP